MRILALLVLIGLSGCSFEQLSASPDGGGGGDGGDGGDGGGDGGPDAPLPLTCPSGYGPISGLGMYRVVETPELSWQAAEADCNNDDDGGSYTGFTHLIVLANETERLAIKGSGMVSGNTWIGLHDLGLEGVYVWVTSEPVGNYPMVGMKPPWDTDDPDNAGAGGEDCVRFKNDFSLEDKPCGALESYVCECDRFPPNPPI